METLVAVVVFRRESVSCGTELVSTVCGWELAGVLEICAVVSMVISKGFYACGAGEVSSSLAVVQPQPKDHTDHISLSSG